ncbi:MAG: hypothetical protein ACTSV2_03735, partial [Candidatus Thorarchaeota archaeon]
MTRLIIAFFSSFTSDKELKIFKEKFDQEGIPVYLPDEFDSRSVPETFVHPSRTYLLVGSGGTEQIIIEFLDSHKQIQSPVLLSFAAHNSLSAAIETNAYLRKRGIKVSHMHYPTIDELVINVKSWVEFEEIVDRIRKSKLGIIGGSSSWLVASQVDIEDVQKQWGFEIVELPIEPLFKVQGKISEEYDLQLRDLFQKAKTIGPSEEELERAGLIFEKMDQLVRQENLNAVTIKCFTLVQETAITACVALSLLNDLETITAGCEGDIASTFTMMFAKYLTGKPAFMANVADIDTSENTIMMAHCAVPFSMVAEFELTTHFETGLSVAPRGRFMTGDVTVLRFNGTDLTEYWVSDGQIIENLRQENNCRTQIRVKLDEPVSYFLESPLGNHHILIKG